MLALEQTLGAVLGMVTALASTALNSVNTYPLHMHTAITFSLTLMWGKKVNLWSQTPPKPQPPALP